MTRRLLALLVALAVLVSGCGLFGDDEEAGPDPAPPIDGVPNDGSDESGDAPESNPGPDADLALAEQYSWEPLDIDAGGWVTGLTSDLAGETLLARTDVGGAYRWDPADERWIQLLSADGVEDPQVSDYAVESVVVAPNDPDRLYLLAGARARQVDGRLLVSTDRGETWTANEQRWALNGNGEWRTAGERMAVDPADPDRLWIGTRIDGLWRSTDGGATVQRVDAAPAAPTVPAEEADQVPGVSVVRHDGTTVYAGVTGVGWVASDDDGATWRTIVPYEGIIHDARLLDDGTQWVVGRTEGGNGNGTDGTVWRIDGGTVTDVSPREGVPYESVAVDPTDPDHVLVARNGVGNGRLWRSTNGGADWSEADLDTSCESIPWLDDYSEQSDFYSVGQFWFDRAEPGRLWFAEGFAVWSDPDPAPGDLALECRSDGIDELVSNDVVVTPGGDLVTAHWDRGLFAHPDGEPAVQGPTPRFTSAWDLDWSPSDPDFVAAVVSDHRFCCEQDGQAYQSGYSTDGGRTWTRFASYENGTHPYDLRFGNLAVAAESTDVMVWLPSFNGAPHFTADGGATWTAVELPGTEDERNDEGVYLGGSHTQYYLNRHVLVADRVEPSTFYLYHRDDGIFVSRDGGASWELVGGDGLVTGWTAGYFNAQLISSPTRAGRLLFTPGPLDQGDFPVYSSDDGGATWTTLDGTAAATALGFGAPATEGEVPTLLMAGTYNGERGVWMSPDDGATWQLAAASPGGNYQAIKTLTGHPDEYGTIVVGFTGTTFLRGRVDTGS